MLVSSLQSNITVISIHQTINFQEAGQAASPHRNNHGRIFILLGKSERLGHQIGRVLSLFYALIVLLLCRMNRSGTLWKKLALITSMMIVFVPECGSYCLFYWTIPFLSFMKHLRTKEMHKTAFSRSDKMYAFLFPPCLCQLPGPCVRIIRYAISLFISDAFHPDSGSGFRTRQKLKNISIRIALCQAYLEHILSYYSRIIAYFTVIGSGLCKCGLVSSVSIICKPVMLTLFGNHKAKIHQLLS